MISGILDSTASVARSDQSTNHLRTVVAMCSPVCRNDGAKLEQQRKCLEAGGQAPAVANFWLASLRLLAEPAMALGLLGQMESLWRLWSLGVQRLRLQGGYLAHEGFGCRVPGTRL